MKGLMQLLREYSPGEEPESRFFSKMLGWLMAEYSFGGSRKDSNGSLDSLWYYVKNHPSKGIYLYLNEEWVRVTTKTFWPRVLSGLPSILDTNRDNGGRNGIVGHQMYGVGWRDRESSLHSWFEKDGGGEVFCDNEGFGDLCESLGVPIVVDETEKD